MTAAVCSIKNHNWSYIIISEHRFIIVKKQFDDVGIKTDE